MFFVGTATVVMRYAGFTILTDVVFKSPLEEFRLAVERAGLNDGIVYLGHGETYNFRTRGERKNAGVGRATPPG